MKGKVPYNIDIEKLVGKQRTDNGKPLRKDVRKNLVDGMVYFLNGVCYDNYDTDVRKEGYKILNNETMENVVGQNTPKRIKNILLSEGIIEVLPYGKGKHSTGYRLTQKYQTGEFKTIEYSDRINQKLLEHRGQDEYLSIDECPEEFKYLEEQFTDRDLKIRTYESYQHLREILTVLIYRTFQQRNFKVETLVSVLNYFGGLKLKIEDLKGRNYSYRFSLTNRRFNSNITSIKKEFRQFLRVGVESLVEVDLKSSQPFILSTILNKNFTESTEEGYNLSTIYPELHNDLQQLRQFVPTNQPDRPEYVLGIHFSEESFRNLQNFVDYDFDSDFYGYILHNGRLKSQSVELNEKVNRKGRSYIKRQVMSFLFERNDDFRTDNLVIEKIQSLFPELTEFIERFLYYYENSTFSYLLQRTESYLILDKVCGYLNRHHPEIPFYTIHDSVLTPIQYSTTVRDVMKDEIFRVTGKRPQVSIKQEFKELDIEEVWGKVKISSKKKIEKVKYSILKHNILKGVSLIDKQELKTEVRGVIKQWMSNY